MNCMQDQGRKLFLLTWFSAVSLVVIFVFTGLAGAGLGPFNLTVSEVSGKYDTEIVPASYTFLIWNLIYLWQTAWVVYTVVALYRKNADGPLYLNPIVVPVSFHLSWIASCGFYIAWLFAWSNEKLFVAFIMLFLFIVCGYVASAVQAIATANNVDKIARDSKKDLIMNYVLIQNGADILYAWCTVAMLVNLSMALTHDPIFNGSISSQTASLISLSILLVLVIGWSVSENTVFYKFFSFVYTWYGVLLWASIGILVKNYNPSNPNTILTIVILAVACVGLAIKITVYVLRTRGKKMHVHEKLRLSPGNE